MANPSLQIGNDNWAIKEDNLLGYSTAGTRFVPQPITMTRATLGTRVNPDGLVEDVALLGSEEVVNGDFELNSDWNNFGTPTTSEQSTEQSHTGNYSWKIIADATQEGIFSPNNFTLTSGLQYTVSLWIYSVSGDSIKSGLNNTNVSVFTERTVIAGQWTNITYEATATSTGASYISILSQNSLNFYVDNVSIKEYTIDNLPRVDYTDGTSSLLVEPQRTNLVTYSEDFSQWDTIESTLTANYGISPDGTQNSTRCVFSGSNQQLRDSITTSSSSTGSIYVKGISGETIKFGVKNSESLFTLNGEWQRIEKQGTETSNIIVINTYSSATARDIQVWGAQVEDGSYPTSYIKTSGSTVTRNQETYEKTGISDLINSEEGVLFVEMAALSDDVTERFISLSDGSLSNRVYIQFTTTTNQIKMGVTKGGSTQASRPETVSDVTEFNKLAISYSQDLFKFYVNGNLVFTDSSGDTFTANTLNRLNFDVGTSGFSKFFGKVKQLQVFKTTDIDLAALTS